MTSMLLFYQNSTKRYETGAALHDSCAVAFLIDPSIFDYALMYVDVETTSPLTSGMTVCDVDSYHLFSDRPKNVHVGWKMNVEKFWKLMLDALSRANECSLKNNNDE